MFKTNEKYKQFDMFGAKLSLTAKQEQLWDKSIEHSFFENIFRSIDEDRFSILYSSKKSRPNVPVNQLVGSLILKHLFNWTYEELFRNLNFNILTRHAIGLQHMSEDVFSEASIFNFQNRLIEHFVQSGEDLLTEVFDGLTASQLKEFGIKTNIQRGDSFLIGSNIIDYTRLQLLIEVLLRLHRILDDKDKTLYSNVVTAYTKQTAGQYIYRVKKEDLPKELQQLAKIYHELYLKLKNKYGEKSVFKIFERAYHEYFVLVEEQIEIAPKLHSAILMSPDDEDATYRDKRSVQSKGYSGHVSETANQENPFNLITDIVTVTNNVDDAKILEDRLPEMIEKTPDLNEYHADGNYGSPNVDKLMDENSITQIQTAVRGKKAFAEMTIETIDDSEHWVRCESGQRVKAEKAKGNNGKGWKAVFDYEKCPFSNKCNTRKNGGKTKKAKRMWYFSEEKILLHKRKQNRYQLPIERQSLRANVEATVKEVKRGVKNGRVRTRTLVRVGFYLSMTSIAVNLTRIHKYLRGENRPKLELA